MEIWEDVYIKPYCRAGPYIVGIFLGYVIFKYKKINMNKVYCILWVFLKFLLFFVETNIFMFSLLLCWVGHYQ